jgi:NADPH:quinone reductase-like Zn-dependent oxidoreductase
MKTEAIVLTKKGKGSKAFERLSWETPALNARQILVESETFGLNYADVMASLGLYREAPARPCVVGYEVVGKIVEVGAELSADLVGKRVLAFSRFGGYAKHVITEEYSFVEITDEPAGDLLALCTQGVTAYYMSTYLAPVRSYENVLIHAAAGGVGSLLIQLCKNAGATVYAKVGNDKKTKLVKELGADFVIDYSKFDYEEELKSLLGDDRLDVSYNPIGGDSFRTDLSLIGSGGRLFLFGGSQLTAGRWGIFSALNFLRKMGRPLPIAFMMRSKSVLGVNMLKIADNKPKVLSHCLNSVVDLYKAGKLKPHTGAEYSIGEFHAAFNHLASGKSEGKLIVHW